MDTTDCRRKWPLAPPSSAPGPNEVFVWRVELDLPEASARVLGSVLSEDERARAHRFKRPEHGRRFTAARAALRAVLGACVGARPEAVRLEYGEHGKPRLAGPPERQELHFNLSHSGAVALIAVASDRRVGIDLEQIRHEIRSQRIAQRFFSEDEARLLDSLPPEQRVTRFFALWTRKEAFIKALGRGLFQPLDGFRVPTAHQLPSRPVPIAAGTAMDDAWHLVDLDAGAGLAAAVVAEGGGWSPRPWQLELTPAPEGTATSL